MDPMTPGKTPQWMHRVAGIFGVMLPALLACTPSAAEPVLPLQPAESSFALSSTQEIAGRRIVLEQTRRRLEFNADRSWKWVGGGSIAGGIGAAALLTGVTIGFVSNDPGQVRWLTEGGVVTVVAGAALGTVALLVHLSTQVELHVVDANLKELTRSEEAAWARVVAAESAGPSATTLADAQAVAALHEAHWKRLTGEIVQTNTYRTIGLYGIAGGAVVTAYGYIQHLPQNDQDHSPKSGYRTLAWCGAGGMVLGGVLYYVANKRYDRLVEERSVVNTGLTPGLAFIGHAAAPALILTARF